MNWGKGANGGWGPASSAYFSQVRTLVPLDLIYLQVGLRDTNRNTMGASYISRAKLMFHHDITGVPITADRLARFSTMPVHGMRL